MMLDYFKIPVKFSHEAAFHSPLQNEAIQIWTMSVMGYGVAGNRTVTSIHINKAGAIVCFGAGRMLTANGEHLASIEIGEGVYIASGIHPGNKHIRINHQSGNCYTTLLSDKEFDRLMLMAREAIKWS